MRGTDAGNPARSNFAALGHKAVQHLHVFVIDVVDLFDAEPVHFLAPEILLLTGCNRFVPTGRPLRGRYRAAASLFWHRVSCLRFLPVIQSALPRREPGPPQRGLLARWEPREPRELPVSAQAHRMAAAATQ